MAGRVYINFDLFIEKDGDRYRAHVLQSGAGEGQAEFSLPFSALELENFILKIGHARRGGARAGRGSDSAEVTAAKEFGAKLFAAVFQGDVYACLRASMEEAESRDQGVRVLLRLPPELADLPWEYLYNPAWNQFFSLSVDTPLVRYLELTPSIRPLAVKPPLRLLVVISSPSDYDPLDVEQEWRDLQSALQPLVRRGAVVIERLESPSLLALQRQLRRGTYHILHFIGHGAFDERKQDGLLIFCDEAGRGHPLSGQDLGTLLRDHNSLRLALLNACEGARTGKNDPFAGVAQSLVQMGLPAVIAMQFEISDAAAILFAQEFYTALADGYGVDAALGDARKAVFAAAGSVEWGTPVLFSRTQEGRVFDLAPAPTTPDQPPVPEPGPRPEIGIFRLLAWQKAYPKEARMAGGCLIAICVWVMVALLAALGAFGPWPTVTPSPTPSLTWSPSPPPPSPTSTASLTPSFTPTLTPGITPSVTPSPSLTATLPAPAGMVWIPEGSFQMGGALNVNEKPVHGVNLNAFWIDAYEVTNADYARCVAAGKCPAPPNKSSATRADYYGNPQYGAYPVLNITWSEADTYCKWRGGRLPSEAEWEKAARGGLDGKQYPWGDNDPACTPGVVNGAQYNSCAVKDVTSVGSFDANAYGVYDMAGNAWEWVNDWYGDNYYLSSPGSNPPGPSGGEYKVLRGGGWNPYLLDLRVALRYYGYPTYRGALIGFRCAASPSLPTPPPTASPAPTRVITTQMALIPAGTFQMGSTQASDEQPVHNVTLRAFWIDVHEVTNAEYAQCVEDGACQAPMNEGSATRDTYYPAPSYANYPVMEVTWEQARDYCRWRGARLPGEAEWEKAARGGLANARYPWGDDKPDCTSAAANGAQFASCTLHDTMPVKSFGANAYGLYDLSGNVSEWVQDEYAADYYAVSPANDPPGPSGDGKKRVVRGGSWFSDLYNLRVSVRNAYDPAYFGDMVGFRCAKSTP